MINLNPIRTEQTEAPGFYLSAAGKPEGTKIWYAWRDGSHVTASGWTEAEAIASFQERE